MSLWSVTGHGGSAAQAPRRESHCLAPGRYGGEDRVDAAKNGDSGGLAGSGSLCGYDHPRFVFFEIREWNCGHAIHNLLEVSLAAARATGAWSALRTLEGAAAGTSGLSRSARWTGSRVIANCGRAVQTKGNALGAFWRQSA